MNITITRLVDVEATGDGVDGVTGADCVVVAKTYLIR